VSSQNAARMRITVSVKTPGHGMARIGERTFVPDRFSARFSFEEDHDVTLDVEVHDGRPEVVAIHVNRGEGQPPLSGDELRRLPVADWVELATEQVAEVLIAPGALAVPAQRDEATRRDVARAVRRRQPLTRERLEEVAYVYRQHPSAAVVARSLHVSRSQAYRLIGEAREQGLIDDEEGD
jgi:hypothetical protein